MVEAVREQVTGAENILWDLSIFYSGVDDPAIERDMQAVQAQADAFVQKYRGRVAQLDAEEMLEAMQEQEAIQDHNGRIGSFASLLFSTDTNNPKYGALIQKATEHNSQLMQKLVFFDLEWNKAPDEAAAKLASHPVLSNYRHYLEAERRNKPYQLSEIEEQLLVEKSVTGRSAWTRFFAQLLGATRYDCDGEELTQEEVLTRLHDEEREVRRKAAEALTNGLRSQAMELTYIFNTLVADKASDDKWRGYPTWITSRNLANKAPDEVVNALVEAVTSSYDIVARHYDLKRRLLGYDELTEYDRYAPLPVKEGDTRYTWEEARDIVLNAYQAFAPRIAEVAGRFFTENWIHAPIQPGKRGGAFCSPTVPSAHPFVLVNYAGKDKDVMTLAHELGHGVHMALTTEKQTFLNAYTPLTTAEMASVFGEMLVFQDLMRKEPDAEARLAMLAKKIEDTFATVFRQVSMNRFEDALHTARRSEGELSTERISELWMETQRAMFQGSVNLGENYGAWWSYIPHFLNTPGYVYAYAFGELLVLALYNIYQERGTAFVPQYLEVLGAGDSDWPDKILAKAGVDLSDPGFWKQGLEAIRALVEQEERLAREVYPEKFR
jgi:oligoendopeptidase F